MGHVIFEVISNLSIEIIFDLCNGPIDHGKTNIIAKRMR